eukprot:461408-Amorphochlora_amoeboformis.AAC.1
MVERSVDGRPPARPGNRPCFGIAPPDGSVLEVVTLARMGPCWLELGGIGLCWVIFVWVVLLARVGVCRAILALDLVWTVFGPWWDRVWTVLDRVLVMK